MTAPDKAPERIWVNGTGAFDGSVDFTYGTWSSEKRLTGVSYVRADAADAMVAAERKRAEKFHRRAQRAEGRLARSGQFMQAIYSWASVPEHKQFWLKAFMKAAIDHARKGSGRYFQVECSYYERRLRKEWAEREEAERLAAERALDGIWQCDGCGYVTRHQPDEDLEFWKKNLGARMCCPERKMLPAAQVRLAALKKEPEA